MTPLQPAPVVMNSTVVLVCNVLGDTPINITWERVLTNGCVEEVFTGNDTTGGNFSLTVNMDVYGTYRCNASNRFGTNSSSVDIIQASKCKHLHSVQKTYRGSMLNFITVVQLVLSSLILDILCTEK